MSQSHIVLPPGKAWEAQSDILCTKRGGKRLDDKAHKSSDRWDEVRGSGSSMQSRSHNNRTLGRFAAERSSEKGHPHGAVVW